MAVDDAATTQNKMILDRLGAARVSAFDLDDSMVELARRRLHGRPVSL